ncbi:MAG: hypothetical protein Q4D51_12915, partial [Eubacteriales bacterium]|nr:hypothetical protein [Eubacteriales bacterium]
MITITAVDDGVKDDVQTNVVNSGMDKIYYHKATAPIEDFENTINEWTEATPSMNGQTMKYSLNLGSNGYYIVYVKIVDKDGNVRYLNSDGITVNKPAPYIPPYIP